LTSSAFIPLRRRFTAADQSLLSQLVSDEPDPAVVAEQRYELETLLEFVRSLDPLERAVIFVRYQRPGEKVHGYATIARELGQPVKAVRAAMRRVEHKLGVYQVVVAERQAFERKLAGLLPTPVLAERASRPSGWRKTLIDWLGRPFGHDAATTASTLASSGGGRGIGSLAIAICLGGTVAGGSYCVITGDVPLTGSEKAQATERAPNAARPRRLRSRPGSFARRSFRQQPPPRPPAFARRPVNAFKPASGGWRSHERLAPKSAGRSPLDRDAARPPAPSHQRLRTPRPMAPASSIPLSSPRQRRSPQRPPIPVGSPRDPDAARARGAVPEQRWPVSIART
jgi:hypothetical protein